MQFFDWFHRIMAHLRSSRQHEVPIEGHDPLSRNKDEDQPEIAIGPHRTVEDCVWTAAV